MSKGNIPNHRRRTASDTPSLRDKSQTRKDSYFDEVEKWSDPGKNKDVDITCTGLFKMLYRDK